MLEKAVRKYKLKALEASEIIQELIEIAKQMKAALQRGEELGLSKDEMAFYDALAENKSAREKMGDIKLQTIAQLLVDKVRSSVDLDWTVRENSRARIRLLVRKILLKKGYPPDLEPKATQLVLEQAEVLCKAWI